MTQSQKNTRVRAITTPRGIEIWHVEDYTVPVVSLRFALEGGTTQDEPDKTGLTYLMAGLMDEGAGEYDAETFHEKLEERAIELSFDADRDYISGSLRILAEEADEAFRLLGLAVHAPRFDEDAIGRVKAQIGAGLRFEENDPQTRAGRALAERAFAGHPYAWPTKGTLESIETLSREDLLAQHKRLFARARLNVVAVGAISPEKLAAGIDQAFGNLPAEPSLNEIETITLQSLGTQSVISLDVPQSTLCLALPGIARLDADYIPAMVVNHILGGGSFTSRLWTEVRETRGLAYSVWSQLFSRKKAAFFLAETATSNERVGESLQVMQAEIARMAADGPSAEELKKAQDFLTGSFALRFDTSRKIAGELMDYRLKGLGMDYMDRHKALVAGVTLADAKRVAQRLFKDVKPLVVAVGKPEGL